MPASPPDAHPHRPATPAVATRRGGARAADGYHHGTLHEALLAAAEALLLEGGVEAFTLRECARRAGVSHAAPAHHFGDARGLLTAFATIGFDRMADLMQRYRAAALPDAEARLSAVGLAYIDFALAHPAHFALMFGRDRLAPDDADLQRAGQRTSAQLHDSLVELMAERGLPPDDLPQRVLLAWAAVHGYATLLVEGQCLEAFGLGTVTPAASSAMGAAVLRLLGPALAAPSGHRAGR
jgi:AcrR family transcriptional regulator